jgi:hypothetical protein
MFLLSSSPIDAHTRFAVPLFSPIVDSVFVCQQPCHQTLSKLSSDCTPYQYSPLWHIFFTLPMSLMGNPNEMDSEPLSRLLSSVDICPDGSQSMGVCVHGTYQIGFTLISRSKLHWCDTKLFTVYLEIA